MRFYAKMAIFRKYQKKAEIHDFLENRPNLALPDPPKTAILEENPYMTLKKRVKKASQNPLARRPRVTRSVV